ncbi:hypothetical protein CDD82_2461 [Ophiocordyceps australis]|uniref:C2 domain-containing protein n=1 Tax=Ophiocordyceps australis TaxID=1399860 RepID=A0A2C5ZV86_9HYPO|nr:hypothetical protein CDD82_2461 [Ophiocordyceps australis]
MSAKDDADDVKRYQAPYSAQRPIPTISRYREIKAARQREAAVRRQGDGDDDDDQPPMLPSWPQPQPPDRTRSQSRTSRSQSRTSLQSQTDVPPPSTKSRLQAAEDPSQADAVATDIKQRRKQLKLSFRHKESAQRQVTDPVTHLPVIIHDFTDEALEALDYTNAAPGSRPETATGRDAKLKTTEQLLREQKLLQRSYSSLRNHFPPPDMVSMSQELAFIHKRIAIVAVSAAAFIALVASLVVRFSNLTAWLGLAVIAVAMIALVQDYASEKVLSAFKDEAWESQRQQIASKPSSYEVESTVWLNSLLGSVWPLINPELFVSLADTLEDVMQASLPRLIRMVSVEDIGQGSEAIRILGIRWLPTGAAAKTALCGGKLSSDQTYDNDVDEEKPKSEGEREAKKAFIGMQAEEGDFVNMEVAFAYRSRPRSHRIKDRTKSMHLYLAFYLPGNVKIPVWVDLRGIVGVLRVRLQLTPDPPFFSLCTMTLLGQPKVDLSCIPLSQRGLNIMDVPLISNFVQSAVDAAVSDLVAPKSLTLDLKDMLAGDDFKKDTASTGVLMVNIKRGYDFKMGDAAIPLIRDGSSDPYVSVGWAKFGKVLWSTRVLECEMKPYWDETCFVHVTPDELNIDEHLRVRLWDSDRFTADDDLGRIEVPLAELLTQNRYKAKMWKRVDGFRALSAGDNMPGKLEWSVGYFAKTALQQCQLDLQTHDSKVRTMEQLQAKVDKICERKLREITVKEGHQENDEAKLKRQRAVELKAEQDAIIISAPPPDGYPSGLLSLQIHNITGLELDKLNKRQVENEEEASDEEETGDSLPSSYCTVIINHNKTFKTRTKPQNAKPFFNAGCERFIRDWHDCEVFVSVRDARLHEENPLLGIVHLPLSHVFRERSQVLGFWPLSGGIGHGRIRLSLVWRSVSLQVPRNLLGWNYGTLDVEPVATSSDCPTYLSSCQLKLKTNISMGKFYPHEVDGKAEWKTKREQNVSLAVKKRYSSCLSVAFRHKKNLFGDKVASFCVLWLKDIPDEEEQELELPIWKGDFERATACCLEECGERVGTLKLKLTFLGGMGNAHARWASRNQDLRDVIEVIETARDNLDRAKMAKEVGIGDEEASSDSDSSSGEHDEADGKSVKEEQSTLDELRDYRRREKALHRQHRGIMQWKIPRTAKWVKNKWGRVEDGVTGFFELGSRQAGVETEG